MLYYYNALLFKDFKQDRDLINSTEMRGLYADIIEKLASLLIGDDISITILNIRSNQVKIGVEAPKEVSVHREEIYHRIRDVKDELQL